MFGSAKFVSSISQSMNEMNLIETGKVGLPVEIAEIGKVENLVFIAYFGNISSIANFHLHPHQQ